ncbi:hypothetical protein MY11210_000259 [Beauveria gryllotalpidicola]
MDAAEHQSKASCAGPCPLLSDERSEYDSELSGMGTMALFVQMWTALDQSMPETQPPLTETTFLA